jgi:hypothetical protein
MKVTRAAESLAELGKRAGGGNRRQETMTMSEISQQPHTGEAANALLN